MEVLTVDILPEEYKIIEIAGMVEITHLIEMSEKPFLRRVLERKKDDHKEACEAFIDAATSLSPEVNMIFGVRVSTALGQFTEGVFLCLTYCGTAAKVERRQAVIDL